MNGWLVKQEAEELLPSLLAMVQYSMIAELFAFCPRAGYLVNGLSAWGIILPHETSGLDKCLTVELSQSPEELFCMLSLTLKLGKGAEAAQVIGQHNTTESSFAKKTMN